MMRTRTPALRPLGEQLGYEGADLCTELLVGDVGGPQELLRDLDPDNDTEDDQEPK
jgi:hypothetical protein